MSSHNGTRVRYVSILFPALALMAASAAAQAPAAAPPPQPAAQTAPPGPITAGWQDGFVLQTPNGDNRLVIGLTAQEDGRFSLDDPSTIVNTFSIRKARPTFNGRIGRYFDFRVMPDLGGGSTTLQDAYFEIHFSTKFRLRNGKDKVPVGYEQLQGDSYLLFPERALPSTLLPIRDVGVEGVGDLAGGRLSYAAGVFNGVLDGTTATDADTNGAKDVAGRVLLQPFRSGSTPGKALSGLGFHLGATTGRETGALPAFKTAVGQQTYYSYAATAVASGARNRVAPAVFYYYKSFGGFAEYVRSAQSVTRAGAETIVANHAWEATGSFVLTGEAASDRGVHPARPFDPSAHHWGALQILARYAALTIDPSAFSGGLAAAGASGDARATTVAANWYPVNYVKYYVAYERTIFDRNVTGARKPEHVILLRAQIAF